MNSKIIGKKLRDLRGEKSIKEVAENVGVAISTVSMYETGERIPKDEIKIKLAKFYGVSVESLFFA